MNKDYCIKSQSTTFWYMILDLYKYLVQHREYIISKQVLRSWTSIWANIREWTYGFSKKDFLYKMSLSLKETAETEFRFDILEYGWYIVEYHERDTTKYKLQEIAKVLTKIVKTTSVNMKNK